MRAFARLGRWLRVRRLARHAWCAYCGVRPRMRGSRYCCPEHAEIDRDDDWSIR